MTGTIRIVLIGVIVIVAVSVLATLRKADEAISPSFPISEDSAEPKLPTFDSRTTSNANQKISKGDAGPNGQASNSDDDKSMIEVFQDLRDNPANRDSEAIEQLLNDLYFCQNYPRGERARDEWVQREREHWVTLESHEEREAARKQVVRSEACASYAPRMLEQTLEWLTELADEGDLGAQSMYLAAGSHLDWDWRLDPDKLIAFRDRINSYYAAATAEPVTAEAFEFLADLHQTGYVGEQDLVLAYAYRFAYLMSQNQSIEGTRQLATWRLDEAELEAAEMLAAELYAACCG